MKIYTRTGDGGMTSLVDGTRVAKSHPRLHAYGTLDELNSFIGLALAGDAALDADDITLLCDIQSILFDLGAWLATDPMTNPELADRLYPTAAESMTLRLENAIDRLTALLPEQHSFILPAGCVTACRLHVARTVARRAERLMLDISDRAADDPAISLVNRLSDYLFVAARRANMLSGIPETPWVKL